MCKFQMVGSLPKSAANDIDYTVIGDEFIKCLKNVKILHKQTFNASLHKLFDINMYSYIPLDVKLSQKDVVNQLPWSFIRVARFIRRHHLVPVLSKRLTTLYEESTSVEALALKDKRNYATLYAEFLTEGDTSKKLGLFNLLKMKEIDSYFSIGAYRDIVMRSKNLSQNHRQQSMYENLGFICVYLDYKKHECNGSWVDIVLPKIAKYLIRVLQNVNNVEHEHLLQVATRVNSRRKRLLPPILEHLNNMLLLLGLTIHSHPHDIFKHVLKITQ
jgi:hypothetical protein